MPITKSAKKALKQSKKKRIMNLQKSGKMKKLIKEIRKFALENKKEEAKKLLPQLYKMIDKAAKAGIIKKNNAARKKSRLTKIINKLSK